jgi:hypothetical protein
MALTVQNALDAFGRYKRDITDVPNATFIEWCDYVNKFAYRKIAGIDAERFIDQSNTFTVTSAPQTSALPSDFEYTESFETGFYVVDDNSNDTTRRLAVTGFGSSKMGYYIQGTNVVFTGIDDSKTIRLRYIPVNTQITALADYFTIDTLITGAEIIPDEYLNYIVKAVDVFYTQWDEDPNAESLADFRFVNVLDELLDNIRKGPSAFGTPDYSVNY